MRKKAASVIVLAVAVVCAVFAAKALEKRLYPKDFSGPVGRYCEEYGLDENFVYAVIHTESGFDPGAVSDAGAVGLTQITEDTFNWIGAKLGDDKSFESLFDPDTSIEYGVFFLSYLLDEFGDYRTAAAAYHAGRGRVNGWLRNGDYSSDGKTLNVIPTKDTAHYVAKITKAYGRYNTIYGKGELNYD